MEKISLPIAGTLAEEAVKVINKARFKVDKTRVAAANKSSEFKELLKIQTQRELLDNRFELLSEKIEKKFPGINIEGYGRRLKVKPKYKSQPQAKSIKNKIIIANQIKGISPSKVVDFVVNEYLSE